MISENDYEFEYGHWEQQDNNSCDNSCELDYFVEEEEEEENHFSHSQELFSFIPLEEAESYEIHWNVGMTPKTVLAKYKHCVSYDEISLDIELVFVMSNNGNVFTIDSSLMHSGLVEIHKTE